MEKYFLLAQQARLNSMSSYSNFMVGSCLVTKSGKTYTGCNIENEGIQSICSERVAFVKALSEGEREFEAIYIVGGPKYVEPNEECVPCGYCREFMSEFVDEDFKIYTTDKEYSIKDLLPNDFKF